MTTSAKTLFAGIVLALLSGAQAAAGTAEPTGEPPRELTQAQAQTHDDRATYYRLDRHGADFVRKLFYDYRTQVSFPVRAARRSPRKFLLGAAGIAALIVADPVTYDAMAPNAGDRDNPIVIPAQTFSEWGNNSSAVPLVLGFASAGIIFNSPREMATTSMLLESLITSATWTATIKWVTGRERPREREERVSDWEGPDVFSDEARALRSFPSGHSTGIWSVATVLANQYPAHGIVPVLSYGTAAAMSYSRMVVGAHWFSDVVVGGLIGYGCARQVVAAHKTGHSDESPSNLRLSLDVMGPEKGLSLTYDF